jgi:hypothetical protein
MKNHLISLFGANHKRNTLILAVCAVLLISVSLVAGISDNLPMIAMLLAGLIFLCFAVLHTWEKASYFAILTAVCFLILILDFIWPFISEDIAMAAGFGCFAGIVTGIIGIFTRIKGWQRLLFGGSLISLVALAIISTNTGLPSKEQYAPLNEWILIIVAQVIITILLLAIGILNKREKWLTKLLLIFAAIVLILLSIWGFHASAWQFGAEVHSKYFMILMFRIYASLEIIIAALSLYACR